MTRLPQRLLFVSFLLLCSALLRAPFARAQASSTASKAADVYAFGGFEHADPDYGFTNNNGGVLGVDFTRYFRHLPVQPSLEIRANFNSGTYASEKSYLFGLRAQYQILRFRPYVDFLVGPGDIHFPRNIGYTGDNSTVFNYGGGIDIDATGNFSLKLDVQKQSWDTGEIAFNPLIGVIGINYRIPFRQHNTQATIRP